MSSLFLYKSWISTISFFICQNIHFIDIRIIYKIFFIKNMNFLFAIFFQRSSLFLYKSWLSTILLNSIHFTDILMKCEIFWIKKKRIVGRLYSYINLDFLQFHQISAKIYMLKINLYNIKSFALKKCNKEFSIFFFNFLFSIPQKQKCFVCCCTDRLSNYSSTKFPGAFLPSLQATFAHYSADCTFPALSYAGIPWP